MSVELGLPGYDDVVEVGSGASGVVYRARQSEFDRDVAIKVLTGPIDDDALSRFDRERRAIGGLSGHSHIVTVYASGRTEAGHPYIVMEYLAGGSLADALHGGRLEWRKACDIGVKIADALAAAHAAGMLHRDVKPENILTSGYGEPKLGDFGIARINDATRTRTGVVKATVAHAAPEVIEGQPASESSDVYSLASTVHALIAGRPAFVRDTDESLIPVYARIATEPVPDLRPQGVPGAVCSVIEHAMAKNPTERIATAAEFAHQLRDAVTVGDAPVLPAVVPGAAVPVKAPKPPKAPKEPRPPKPAKVKAPKPPKPPKEEKDTVPSSGSRGRLVAIGAVVVLVAGGAAVALGGGGGGDVGGDGQTSIASEVVATIDVGDVPTGLFFDSSESALLVANSQDPTITRIDAATNTPSVEVDFQDLEFESGTGEVVTIDNPIDVVVVDGVLWATVAKEGTDGVFRLDSADGSSSLAGGLLGDGFGGVAVGGGFVWAVGEELVFQFDAATGTMVDSERVGDVGAGADAIAADADAAWVTNPTTDTVTRVDATTGEATDTITVPNNPFGITIAVESVWVATEAGAVEIDMATRGVVRTIEISSGLARDIAFDGTDLWVTLGASGLVERIDPVSGDTLEQIGVGSFADAVTVGGGSVWVADTIENTVSRIVSDGASAADDAVSTPPDVSVAVLNGSGVEGADSAVSEALLALGYDATFAGNADAQAVTTVACRAGFEEALADLLVDVKDAFSIPFPDPAPTGAGDADCIVVLG